MGIQVWNRGETQVESGNDEVGTWGAKGARMSKVGRQERRNRSLEILATRSAELVSSWRGMKTRIMAMAAGQVDWHDATCTQVNPPTSTRIK